MKHLNIFKLYLKYLCMSYLNNLRTDSMNYSRMSHLNYLQIDSMFDFMLDCIMVTLSH